MDTAKRASPPPASRHPHAEKDSQTTSTTDVSTTHSGYFVGECYPSPRSHLLTLGFGITSVVWVGPYLGRILGDLDQKHSRLGFELVSA